MEIIIIYSSKIIKKITRYVFFLHYQSYKFLIVQTDLELTENDHVALFLATFRVDISLARTSREFIVYHDLSLISTAGRFAWKIGNRRIPYLLPYLFVGIGYTECPGIIKLFLIYRFID